jgi:hypothetical protein
MIITMIWKIILSALIFGMSGNPPGIVPEKDTKSTASASAFTISYTVDKMSTEAFVKAPVIGKGKRLQTLPHAERMRILYQVQKDGSFFCEIFPLESPYETELPHEVEPDTRPQSTRLLITPGRFRSYDSNGRLLFEQEVEDFSFARDFFGDGYDPIGIRKFLLENPQPENVHTFIEQNGGVILSDGFISFQNCGPGGPIEMTCQPGACTRIVLNPNNYRPILAEHAMPGLEPYYRQYFDWSADGETLNNTIETELFEHEDGSVTELKTLSKYYDFSITQ